LASIIDPRDNAQLDLARFSDAGRNPEQHPEATSRRILGRKEQTRLGETAIAHAGTDDPRRQIPVRASDPARDEDSFVVNILPGDGGFDHKLGRIRHRVGSLFFRPMNRAQYFQKAAGKICGFLKCRR
jgi:hypothetical protein